MARIELVEFHSFFAKGLDGEGFVVDLGANVGNFSKKMNSRYGVRCIGAEANPNIFEDLKKNAFIDAHNIALHDHVGTLEINLSSDVLSSSIFQTSTHSVEGTAVVPCMDLESFVKHVGVNRINLLKVDIEGAEIAMLAACSDEFLKQIPQITIEFHDFCGITPPEQIEETRQRMRQLGFDVIRFSRVGHQDTLFVNRSLLPISNVEFLYAKYVHRNLKGGMRLVRKLIFGKKWAEGYS